MAANHINMTHAAFALRATARSIVRPVETARPGATRHTENRDAPNSGPGINSAVFSNQPNSASAGFEAGFRLLASYKMFISIVSH